MHNSFVWCACRTIDCQIMQIGGVSQIVERHIVSYPSSECAGSQAQFICYHLPKTRKNVASFDSTMAFACYRQLQFCNSILNICIFQGYDSKVQPIAPTLLSVTNVQRQNYWLIATTLAHYGRPFVSQTIPLQGLFALEQ